MAVVFRCVCGDGGGAGGVPYHNYLKTRTNPFGCVTTSLLETIDFMESPYVVF